jgi:hypothetical protein
MRQFALLLAIALVTGCAPGSSETAAGPRSTTFTGFDSRGELPVEITVVDDSQMVSEARPATPVELAAEFAQRPMEGAAGGLTSFGGSDSAVLLVWAGDGCDRWVAISVSAAADRLSVNPRPTGDCDQRLAYRGVVLTFSAPVDVGAITLDLR